MFLIYGWGKKAKEVAYLGIMKCENCKNHSHFTLYELGNEASVYFIRVARWNKKYYAVCDLCEAGWEVDAQHKDDLLKISTGLPDRQTVERIWDHLDSEVATLMETDKLNAEALQQVTNNIKDVYGDEAVDYVADRYVRCLLDEDRPA